MINFCQFMKGIEADPYAMVPQLTVREYLALRDHVLECKECYRIVQEVSAIEPEGPSIKDMYGEN